MKHSKRIAITGLGCCSGAGLTVAESWNSVLSNRVNCLPAAPDFFDPHKASPLFSVKSEDGRTFDSPDFTNQLQTSHLQGINRTTALALSAIAEALDHAQLQLTEISRLRVGVALGTTVGCTFHNEPYYINWKKDLAQEITPVFNYLLANLAERIQLILGLHGPRVVVTNACASGTDAIGIAKQWLENDMCDIAFAGGADEISRIACHGFSSLMLFSQEACTPFDEKRKGLNLGEGAGIVVLEKEANVNAKSNQPVGWVHGYGSACDAYHPTAPHPEGRGLQKAIQTALKDAGVTIDQISFINAHGTGTQANDQAELTGLKHIGINHELPIVSTKGVTGHTLGAAGGIEAVLTVMALRERKSSGTTGCSKQDPKLPLPVCIEADTISLNGSIGMSQSLAFGGGNSVLIFEANN